MYKIRDVLNVIILSIKAKFGPDVLTIPDNLGNGILISNSAITTSTRIMTIIRITLLGKQTPFNLVAFINKELRRYGLDTVVDYTIKLRQKDYTTKKATQDIKLNSATWRNNVEVPKRSGMSVEESQWALDSVDMLTSTTAYDTYFYLKVWSTNGEVLNKSLKIIKGLLTKAQALFYVSTYTLLDCLKESSVIASVMSNSAGFPCIGNIPPEVGAEPLYASVKGTTFGVNTITNEPYTINFETETEARNILVLSGSGNGKTYLITNVAQSALEGGSRAVCVDIKGNEYTELVRSVGGTILDLSDTSSSYIDCVVRKKEYTTDHKAYFNSMDEMLLNIFCILSGGEVENNIKVIIANFISTMWTQLGVLADNEDTWYLTENLDIYKVFENFKKYCYNQFQVTENKELFSFLDNISRYLSRDTEFKQIFKNKIDLNELMETKAINFQFKILIGNTIDKILFRLRWLFMETIMQAYSYYNYSHGLRTFKIMEEAQIVGDDVMDLYCTQWTLGRSLNQDNVFIANSLDKLLKNPKAAPILENAKILLFSRMETEQKNTVIERFELQSERQLIDELNTTQAKFPFFIYCCSKHYPPAIISALSTGERPKVLTPEKNIK